MNVQYLAGAHEVHNTVLPPYDDLVCEFLDTLAGSLRRDSEAKKYPDVQTFAFWCRKANIQKLKKVYQQDEPYIRLGKGVIFHIAPSNVPINAGFTYVMGLLAGNSNVVRVSGKRHLQVLCLCRVLEAVLENPIFEKIRFMTSFITYEKDATITDAYSATCAMRVIWGGDRTIQEIRKSPLPPRSTEITFADRYSFGILNGSFINQASDSELQQLAKAFYNDTYLMDQNACSAPHLLFWQEGSEAAKKRFWNSVYQVALDYELEDQKVSDKYSLLCEKVTNLPEIATVEKYNNLLYVVNLDYEKMNQNAQDVYRGIYGLFYQTDIE